MKTIAIITFTTIFMSFIIIQAFVLKHIYKDNVEAAKKSAWTSFFVIVFGTYAVFLFITDESNLNVLLQTIFTLYLAGMLIFQAFETIRLRKYEKIGFLGVIPFISRAISMVYMLAYLSLYMLP